MDGAQAAGIVQVLLGQQQGHGAARLGQVRSREGLGGEALQEAFLVARGGLGQDGLKDGAGFLAHASAIEEGEAVFQQAQAPGMAGGDARPFLGGGSHTFGAFHIAGALGFGFQFHSAFWQGDDAGVQGVPHNVGVRHAAVVGEVAGPGGLQADAVLFTGGQLGPSSHDGVPVGDDALLLPAGFDEATAPGLHGTKELGSCGLADHLPALFQQGISKACHGGVFTRSIGVTLIVLCFPSFRIVGHIHAVHPVIGVVGQAWVRSLQCCDG